MAATYEPISTTTLSSAASSITFSSIPGTYTDLRLVASGFAATAIGVYLQFNSDTGTNYSKTLLRGDGTSAVSTRATSATSISWFDSPDATYPSLLTADIFSYAGSTNKTVLTTQAADKNGSGTIETTVGLWRSTAAITTVKLFGSGNFSSGFTATLYGIKAA